MNACINATLTPNEVDCEQAGLPVEEWCPPCRDRVEREVRLEEEMNSDLIERHNLRGITPPDY